MNKNQLCIATISLVRNEKEEADLRLSLAALSSLGMPVFITDGGSAESFVDFIKSLPGFVVFSEKGLWLQAKTSLAQAAKSGASMILYTEPDKMEFFAMHLPKLIEAVEAYETTGVIVASRSEKSFATFPRFQQMTEKTINNCCAEVIGKKADYCYGPFLFNPLLFRHLHSLPENIGWGWRPFLFAVAHRLGLSVDGFTGDFTCPIDQREEDEKERIYRIRQLAQNIEGLLLATSASP